MSTSCVILLQKTDCFACFTDTKLQQICYENINEMNSPFGGEKEGIIVALFQLLKN